MSERLIHNLRAAIIESGDDMKTISIKAGLGETYVRDIVAGRVLSPTQQKLAKVAKALNKTVSQLTGEEALAEIAVVGYCDASNRVYFYFGGLSKMQYLREPDIVEYKLKTVALPPGSVGGEIAIEISQDSFYPKGSLYYCKQHKIITKGFDTYLGKTVIAELPDATHYIRELDKGSEIGCYTLLDPLGRNHIKNVKPIAVAPLSAIVLPD